MSSLKFAGEARSAHTFCDIENIEIPEIVAFISEHNAELPGSEFAAAVQQPFPRAPPTLREAAHTERGTGRNRGCG